jgi:NAD(P)-dependent dehydrogenase (short-subunit alcohol dehydrogenase family)
MTDRITSGLDPYTDARDVVRGQNLSGRTVIVTGGATGIGVETARALAEAGAEVVLAVRNLEAGAATAADIGHGVTVEHLDLSSLDSIRAFATRWGERPLHVLINNAGVMACPQSYTADGLEMQIGTNHFGHFLLSVLLLPALKAASTPERRSRVVTLSSIGHLRSGIHFDDPNYRTRPYDKWEAYGQSKSANALFAVGWQARHGDAVTANSVMPGGIMTPLQRHLPYEEQVAMGWIDAETGKVRDGFKTPAQGASTSVWAAIGPELEGVGGRYLENLAEAPPYDPAVRFVGVRYDHALDPQQADRLWALSAETVGAG